MSKNKQNNKWIIFSIVLFIQLIIVFYVFSRKQGFFIDEIYSYVLSNSYYADSFSSATNFWGKWLNSNDLLDFVSVQPGQRFSFDKVYLNNSLDCHPPLYYWILHTMCSFFPNSFSKWLGLSINVLFYLITAFFIFLLCDKLFENSLLKFLPLVTYGFSVYFIETITLIRMYMLLALFVSILNYVFYFVVKNGIKTKYTLFFSLCIFLGGMTQYYFLVYAFFVVLIYCAYLLFKNWKESLLFGLVSLLPVILIFVVYPFIYTQATGSSTNNIGNEISTNLFNISLFIQMLIQLAKSFLVKLSYHLLASKIIVIIVAFVICISIYYSLKTKLLVFDNYYMIVLASTFATIIFISFIGGNYVYLRYIYFIIPNLFIAFSLCLKRCKHNTIRIISTSLTLFGLLNILYGSYFDLSKYLYRESFPIELKNYSCFGVVNEKESAIPTGNFMNFYSCKQIFIDTFDNYLSNNEIDHYLESNDNCLVYITTDSEWTLPLDADEVISKLVNPSFRVEYVASGSLGDYYLISKS